MTVICNKRPDFQIVAVSEQGHVLLRDGFAVSGTLQPNTFHYFKYFHNDEDSSVQIETTGLSGLLDMYVARNNPRPSEQKHDFETEQMGAVQYVYIPFPLSVGLYYIGITSKISVSYSIVVNTRQSMAIYLATNITIGYSILREGITIFYNHVIQGYYRYFIFDLEHRDEEVVVTANPWVGNTDLFISMTNPYPTKYNYTWASQSALQDTVIIPVRLIKLQSNSISPQILRSNEVAFTLAYTHSNELNFLFWHLRQIVCLNFVFIVVATVALVDGIPFKGIVKRGKYRYYKIYNPYTSGVAVEIKSDAPNDVDMYISRTTEKPSPLDHEYKSENPGHDEISIKEINPGWLYIAVYGYYGQDIHYSLTATLGM